MKVLNTMEVEQVVGAGTGFITDIVCGAIMVRLMILLAPTLGT